jgi:hypothetical protein
MDVSPEKRRAGGGTETSPGGSPPGVDTQTPLIAIHPSIMKNPQVNQRIRVTTASRGYDLGTVYLITKVDHSDNTLIARDAQGREGSWIKWDVCMLAGPNIAWDWLKTQLPSEVLELLSAFNGLEALSLKPEVRDHILSQLPNLRERILRAQIALDEEFGGEPLPDPDAAPAEDSEHDFCIP